MREKKSNLAVIMAATLNQKFCATEVESFLPESWNIEEKSSHLVHMSIIYVHPFQTEVVS